MCVCLRSCVGKLVNLGDYTIASKSHGHAKMWACSSHAHLMQPRSAARWLGAVASKHFEWLYGRGPYADTCWIHVVFNATPREEINFPKSKNNIDSGRKTLKPMVVAPSPKIFSNIFQWIIIPLYFSIISMALDLAQRKTKRAGTLRSIKCTIVQYDVS